MTDKKVSLLDAQTGKSIAHIALVGKPIEASKWMSSSGSLQSFTILSGNGNLQDAWLEQKAILLRSGNVQQLVKIATYPSDGENQGHLDFIKGTRAYCEDEEQAHLKTRTRRGLALLQTLLGS